MLISPDEDDQINPPWLTGLPANRAAEPQRWSM
jgi:hypothetical protein